MKILHTSDWHLGQNFYNKRREEEHQKFIDWLLITITEQSIDAVIIAGDLFDTTTPPSYARALYNQFAIRMAKLDCPLFLLGGNHDSVSMLNESKDLFQHINIQVIANVTNDLSSQIHVINNKQGEPGAILCAIPFIRPSDVLTSKAGQSQQDKQSELSDAISAHYSDLYTLAVAKNTEMETTLPIIATGHLTAIGAKISESVRDIYIGTLEAFPAKCFPPADYIALGHIHRPQIVAKSDHIRYCGSPIALSFDELKSTKQVLIAEFTDNKLANVLSIKVPQFQPMQAIRGDFKSIEKQLSQPPISDNSDEALPTWLSIEIEEDTHYSNAREKIDLLVNEINVEVLFIKRINNKKKALLEHEHTKILSELTPVEVFEKRLESEPSIEPKDIAKQDRLRKLFKNIVDEIKEQ